MFPHECTEAPKPKEPAKLSHTPSPPVPSAMASNSCSDQSRNTRRVWCRDRPQHPPTPNPDSPNDLVIAYTEEREELLSWWREFWSLCHKGTGPLSNSQVQELARKQAVGFRLPTAQEKGGWWSAPPSLIILRCRDFLPSLPPRVQCPRGICVVRRDQIVALAQALQWCAELSGTPLGYSVVQSRTFVGVSSLLLRGMIC